MGTGVSSRCTGSCGVIEDSVSVVYEPISESSVLATEVVDSLEVDVDVRGPSSSVLMREDVEVVDIVLGSLEVPLDGGKELCSSNEGVGVCSSADPMLSSQNMSQVHHD
jgi:hypothetical protein